jgi:hypothetical protein
MRGFRQKCALLIMVILAGCSKVTQFQKQNIIAQRMDAIYFSDVFLNSNSNEIDIEQQMRKLRQDYTWESTSDVFENTFSCTYSPKNRRGATDECSVTCEYLGSWREYDIVARHHQSGGSGNSSDIILSSSDGKKIRVYKTILYGDRAVDGMLSHPVFDGAGKIYF